MENKILMRPCDCTDQFKTKELKETGLKINDYWISVGDGRVVIVLSCLRFWIPLSIFKKFVEWFLEDQK